jgi:hypothetical protein
MEILIAHAPAQGLFKLGRHQHGGRVLRQYGAENVAPRTQAGDGVVQRQFRIGGIVRRVVVVDFRQHRLPGAPAMFDEIVRNAGEHIGAIFLQIAVPVLAIVHCIGPHARRHELRYAHGARVGAERPARVDIVLAGQQQELFELAPEEVGPRRIIEPKRRKRIQDTVAAHVAAVGSLHTGDGHQVLLRHAGPVGDARQFLVVRAPDLDAPSDTFLVDEPLPVFPPCQRALGWTLDEFKDARLGLRLAQDAGKCAGIEAVLRLHVADESLHLLARDIQPVRCIGRRRQAGKGQQGRKARTQKKECHFVANVSWQTNQEPTSFRCEYSAIRIPKLASRVTIEVPP